MSVLHLSHDRGMQLVPHFQPTAFLMLITCLLPFYARKSNMVKEKYKNVLRKTISILRAGKQGNKGQHWHYGKVLHERTTKGAAAVGTCYLASLLQDPHHESSR